MTFLAIVGAVTIFAIAVAVIMWAMGQLKIDVEIDP